jgi:mono/diheme cytochrome c family protein
MGQYIAISGMYRHAPLLPLVTLGVLSGCSAGTSTAPQPVTSADAGARMYEGNCTSCHQQDARGIPGVYPSLAGSPVVLGDPQELARWVVKGVRPSSMPAGRYPTAMANFGWMKAADAAVLLTYVRSNFGNTAGPVDPASVSQALAASP